MFTGIIEDIGQIKNIKGNLFTISHHFSEPFEVGESVSLSGMCATVLKTEGQTFTVEIMEESRNRTIFGDAEVKTKINLERSAKIGTRNSGHFVLGHVDQIGEILDRKKVEDFELFRISIFPENEKFIVPKGSIAVDGISLTISNLGKNCFEVSIISHTLTHTTLGEKQKGDKVNLEFDILGKYILRANELDTLS